MRGVFAGATLLVLGLGAPDVRAQAATNGFEAVDVAVSGERAGTIKAYLRRPTSASRRGAAIVALHGCAGLFRRDGRFSARVSDWADRWVAAGYAVIFPDSFTSRGFRQICTLPGANRPIRPRHRAQDAFAAAAWLAQQPFVDSRRLALVGWSNGGSAVLAASGRVPLERAGMPFRTAIAFYPGCRPFAQSGTYAVGLPLTVLIGSADDWTPPEPCRQLAKKPQIKLIEYPGAVHGFDAPGTPRRTLKGVGLSARGDGKVEIGTDPKARAAAIEAVAAVLREAFKAGGDGGTKSAR